MNEHTPGPWTAINSYHSGAGKTPTGTIIDSDTKMVLDGQPCAAMDIDEMHANARLIAAAPDLLQTLKDVVEIIVNEGDVRDYAGHIFAAIAKATNNTKSATP